MRRTGAALGYLAAGVAAGPAGLLWSIAAVAAVAVLGVTQLGGPAFLGAAWVTRRLAWAERHRAAWVLGRPIDPPYLPAPAGTLRRRVAAVGAQPATWRDLAWLVLLFPLGIGLGVAGIVVTAVTVGMATAPAWAWAVPNPRAPFPVKPLMTTGGGRLLLVPLGLALLPLAAWLVRRLARLEVSVARALLAPGEHRRLVEETERLARTRARVVDAQAAELRRIERDLHDGAQARIVAAGMTLALAARKLRGVDSSSVALSDVDTARRQLDEALAELRRLVRGIHPPILTDRGLHAALAALAGDSPLPVVVRGDPALRFPAAVESAAYFVAAEGLANAAKHSDAGACVLELRRTAAGVCIIVEDDGRGGADPAGAGLDGLRRRVEALDGILTVDSPPGGPTLLRAELPCAS
ncbi:sensor domain-containing protein [Dactylosporangium sp. NPDC049140]|uniref:sensor histidine kinase n=1 Tax=Dactylosporangium sp. NPDC049140 TaxID=3155647 RepID=UPI0033C7AD4B